MPFFTTLAVASAAAVAGVATRRRPTFPHLVDALIDGEPTQATLLPPQAQQMITRAQELVQDLWGDTRQQHQQSLSITYTDDGEPMNLVDGTMTQGAATIDQHMLTGKSQLADNRERLLAEARVNRDLALSALFVGMAGAGAFVAPLLVLASIPGFIYLSFSTYKKALRALRNKEVTVDTLLMAATVTAFGTGFTFWMGLTYLLYFLGEKLTLKIQNQANQGFIDVFKQYPQLAWIEVDGAEVQVPVDQLQVGDVIVVRAGATIPVDGTIIAGTASVDQHILTGESQLAEKTVGDYVFASTVLLAGRIYIEVDKAGTETTVARIGQILNDTMDFKSGVQLRAETLANRTVLPTLLLSAVAFPIVGASSAICVLQSHFSYRMRLVAPISTLSYFNLLSESGLLVKDGRTLDLLTEIDTIVFDKTGTLTQEQPHVGQVFCCAGYGEDDVLAYAAAAEQRQAHPIAKAIVAAAEARQIEIFPIEEADYKIGYGLTVLINGQRVQVGSERFMALLEIALPPDIADYRTVCHRQGHSLIMVALNNRLIGAIELVPTIRPEARAIIQQLRQYSQIKAFYIISGDQHAPTEKLAGDLGIDHYFAETLPEQKAVLIEQLQAEGRKVCFIGDGINDSIALKKAQVSISLKGASSVATDTAQIILMDGALKHLPQLFQIATEFQQNINTGFKWLLIPSIIGMGGAIFLHFGILHAVLLTQAGLIAGVANGIRPRLKMRKRKVIMGEFTIQS